MKITNVYDIHRIFTGFSEANAHDPEGADLSVTALIDPPQIRKLQRDHYDDLVHDVSDDVMAIVGTALHKIAEDGSREDDIVERRFHATVDGTTISGQVDLLECEEDGTYSLRDLKTTGGKGLSMRKGKPDPSWEKQVNIYSWLAEENGIKLNNDLGVICFVRDWSRNARLRDPNFPQSPVVYIPIWKWDREETLTYIKERIKVHKLETPPECTSEERWGTKPVYAVMEFKANGEHKARATRLFDSMFDAEEFILSKDLKAEVVARRPKFSRCEGNYCGVAEFCNQWNEENTQ